MRAPGPLLGQGTGVPTRVLGRPRCAGSEGPRASAPLLLSSGTRPRPQAVSTTPEAQVCRTWAAYARTCPCSPLLAPCSGWAFLLQGPPCGRACDPALPVAVPSLGRLQEKSLEHLRASDRSSLLSEIQALRAQLRMTHLQNQEKLQQLCAALTSAEARGSRQEHQLRRQGERCPSSLPAARSRGSGGVEVARPLRSARCWIPWPQQRPGLSEPLGAGTSGLGTSQFIDLPVR